MIANTDNKSSMRITPEIMNYIRPRDNDANCPTVHSPFVAGVDYEQPK